MTATANARVQKIREKVTTVLRAAGERRTQVGCECGLSRLAVAGLEDWELWRRTEVRVKSRQNGQTTGHLDAYFHVPGHRRMRSMRELYQLLLGYDATPKPRTRSKKSLGPGKQRNTIYPVLQKFK